MSESTDPAEERSPGLDPGEPFSADDAIPPPTQEELEEGVRRSIFATHIAYGEPIPDALHAAGYTSTSLHLGWTLLSYPDVRDEVDAHRSYIRSKAARTVNELIEQLDRDREFARDTRNAAVASACTIAQAKILGAMDASNALRNGQKRLVLTWGGDDGMMDITTVAGELTETTAPVSVKTGTDDA